MLPKDLFGTIYRSEEMEIQKTMQIEEQIFIPHNYDESGDDETVSKDSE